MTLVDVAIIGGGASGTTTAFHLSSKGKKTCILEKSSSSPLKICGGGMSAAVQNWFPFKLNPIVDEVITKVEFSWCLKDKVIAELSGTSPFWIVKRENLDSLLLNQALNSGSELLNKFNVVKIKKKNNIWQLSSLDGRQIEAKAIVIADGSQSPWPAVFNLGPKKQNYASTFSGRIKGEGNLSNEDRVWIDNIMRNNKGIPGFFPINSSLLSTDELKPYKEGFDKMSSCRTLSVVKKSLYAFFIKCNLLLELEEYIAYNILAHDKPCQD